MSVFGFAFFTAIAFLSFAVRFHEQPEAEFHRQLEPAYPQVAYSPALQES